MPVSTCAGQERAIVGAAFSRGRILATDRHRVQCLVAAQEQPFCIFADFADTESVAHFNALLAGRDSTEVERMRAMGVSRKRPGELMGARADAWFEHTTRRIDAMKVIEDQMATNIGQLCEARLTEANVELNQSGAIPNGTVNAMAPVAMVVIDVDPALNQMGLDGGVGLYTLDGAMPKPMRSILAVVQAQSRRIDEVSDQLESARLALAERKVIDRAKGLIMRNRRVSETEAYALLRESAMNQNKRIVEIAEALVSTADILKT